MKEKIDRLEKEVENIEDNIEMEEYKDFIDHKYIEQQRNLLNDKVTELKRLKHEEKIEHEESLMTLPYAQVILEYHNEWRRDNDGKFKQISPEILGKAIEFITENLPKLQFERSYFLRRSKAFEKYVKDEDILKEVDDECDIEKYISRSFDKKIGELL